ncbi:glycosyltransferase family 20 protein, partial [Erysiphe pulchra]
GKLVTVGAFPIGIDPEKFSQGLQKPNVVERVESLKRRFENVKIIVGVDRLDYIKVDRPGCPCASRCAFPPRRRGVPESPRRRQRAGWPHQRQIRHDRVHAYSLPAQVRELRRAHRTLRCLRRLPGLLHTRRHEPRFLRVHRLPGEAPRRYDSVRVRWRRAESERLPHRQPLEHRGAGRCNSRLGHHGSGQRAVNYHKLAKYVNKSPALGGARA